MTMLQNGGITETAYIISCNIHAFVRRAVFEDREFYTKDYKEKLKVLERYADEVRAEAETKATEKAQQQADFGGLDNQPSDNDTAKENTPNSAEENDANAIEEENTENANAKNKLDNAQQK